MKLSVTIGVAALACLGLAARAQAYAFSPIGGAPGGAFVATGAVNVSKGAIKLRCTARFAGTADKSGGAHITGVSFKGGLCSTVSPTGLPWAAMATGPNAAVIAKVAIKASLAGGCGPGDVPISIGPSGVVTLGHVALAPDCTITGALDTVPPVTIVGP